jgi:hypothetical protein
VTLFNDNQVAYYDPTADVTTDWNDGTGTSYTEIDEGDRAPDTPASLATYIQENTQNAVAEFNISSITQTQVVEINFWAYVTTGSNRYINMDCYEDGVSKCTQTSVPLSTTEEWYSANWTSIGGIGVADYVGMRFTNIKQGGGGPTDTIAYNGYIAVIYTPPSNPYIIDFEYQWTLAEGSWDNTTFELEVYVNNDPATEDLDVYYWTSGSSWSSLGTISSSGWFNVSLSTNFNTPDFTIRFVGNNETGDDTQDSWDIDLMLITTSEPESRVNRFDREVAFLNVTKEGADWENGTQYFFYDSVIQNSGFEDGDTSHWDTDSLGSCSGAVSNPNRINQTYGYDLDCSSGQSGYLEYKYNLTAADLQAVQLGEWEYNISLWIRSDCGSTDLCYVHFREYKDNWATETRLVRNYTAPTGLQSEVQIINNSLVPSTDTTGISVRVGVGPLSSQQNDIDFDRAWIEAKDTNEEWITPPNFYNYGFEVDDPTGWTFSSTCSQPADVDSVLPDPRINDQNAYYGKIEAVFEACSTYILYDLNITEYASLIDDENMYLDLSYYTYDNSVAADATMSTAALFYENDFTLVHDLNPGTSLENNGWFDQNLGEVLINATTRIVRIRIDLSATGTESGKAGIDDLIFKLKYNGTSGDLGGYIYSNIELAVNTGSLDADEVIQVDMWNETESSWNFIVNLTSASSWTNTSIVANFTQNMYFRFVDTNQSVGVDLDTDTWEIDYFALHLWNSTSSYRLDWEHQATSIPSGGQITVYQLTIYGKATEDIDIFMWNSSSSAWNDTKAITMSSTLQWYNVSVFGFGLTGSTMTWNYRDTVIASDVTQHELSIDYAGIYVYSMDVNISDPSISVSSLPNGGDVAFNEFPEQILTDSGTTFTVQIRGTDTSGTPVNDGWIYFDTDSDPAGYTQLTTSWQNLYTSQDPSVTSLNVWLWVNVPTGQLAGDRTFDLEVQIFPT